MAGDFNTKLDHPERYWKEEIIVAVLATAELEDTLAHLLTKRLLWCQDGRTWSMVWLGREVWSRMDYILGKDRCLFKNVAVQDPRHKLDHYLVLGCLHRTPLREHIK